MDSSIKLGIKIPPMGVHILDQLEFPGARTRLDLLFPGDDLVHALISLVPDEQFAPVRRVNPEIVPSLCSQALRPRSDVTPI